MSNNAESTMPLSEATRTALDQSGITLLTNSGRFLGSLLDFTDPDSDPMKILIRNCDDEFLAPLVAATCRGSRPEVEDLQRAAGQCAAILVKDRSLDSQRSIQVVNLLCDGIARHLGLTLQASQAPATPRSDASGNQATRTPAVVTPKRPQDFKNVPSNQTPPVVRHVEVVPVPPHGSPSQGQVPQQQQQRNFGQKTPTPSSNATVAVNVSKPSNVQPPTQEPHVTTRQNTGPAQDAGLTQQGSTRRKPNKRTITIIAGAAAACIAVALIVVFGFSATARFDGNGQTDGRVSAIHAWKHSEITLPENTFERTGYAFGGWMLDGDESDLHQPGETVVMDNSTTFVASWVPLAVFDGNGADSGKVKSIKLSDKSAITLPKNAYKRKGYRFGGWSTNPNGKSPTKATTKVEVSDEPIIYYAAWRPVVTYDGNGADSGTVKSASASPAGRITLRKNAYKRSGYRFVGWATSPSGKPTKAGKKITVKGPTTLYAVWRTVVSFDANGAPNGTTKSVHADENGMVTLRSCGYSWAYHTFVGWSTSESGEASYAPGDEYDAYAPAKLYAVWELDPSIVEKLNVEVINREWDHGDNRSQLLLVRNDSDSTLDIAADFSCKDASGATVETVQYSMSAIGPGQTTLLVGGSKRSDVVSIDYSLKASDPGYGRGTLWNQIAVEETEVSYDKLVLRLTNHSDRDAHVLDLLVRGIGYGGGEGLRSTLVFTTLAPGESTDVSFEGLDSGYHYDWPSYYERTYYLNGYLD